MVAFLAVWTAVAALAFAVVNLTLVPFEWRLLVMLVWGIADAVPLTLAGLVLWSLRKADRQESGVAAQRLQAQTAVALALLALAMNCAYLAWYYATHVAPRVTH